MSEYEDREMRWSLPRDNWDGLRGKRARRELCHGGAFGRARMVVAGDLGQHLCRLGLKRFTLVPIEVPDGE